MIIKNNLDGKAFENGYTLIQNGGSVIIGISPGNSYFKKAILQQLLAHTSTLFSRVYIMIFDQPGMHNYRAIGFPEIKAERYIRLNGNNIRNNSAASLATLPNADRVRLVDWNKEVENNEHYKHELEGLYTLYNSRNAFYKDIRETTEKVIVKQLPSDADLNSAVDEAVHYILKELAFFSAAPTILNEPGLAFVYHRRFSVLEKLIAGEYDGIVRDKLGFIIIQIPDIARTEAAQSEIV